MSNHLSKSIVWKFVAFSVLRKRAYRGIPVAFGHIYWVFVRRQLRTLTLLAILATTTTVICTVAAHIKAVMDDTAAAYCGLDNILGVFHQYSWWTSAWLKCELRVNGVCDHSLISQQLGLQSVVWGLWWRWNLLNLSLGHTRVLIFPLYTLRKPTISINREMHTDQILQSS